MEEGEVKHTPKVRRRSSFENLLSLFKKKPKPKCQSSEPRTRSGSADLTVTRSSLTSISLGKVERHQSDAGSQRRPSLTSLLTNRAARFKSKAMKEQVDSIPSLGDLGKAVIAGHLDHKRAKKWTSLWCVVADQTLFGFRSQERNAHPVIQIKLRDCTLAASNKSIFRLCQFNAHSFYFRAHSDFDQWLQELEGIVRAGYQFDASPKISPLSLTHPLNGCHSPTRSPNLLARSLNFPSPSPRDPRKLTDSNAQTPNEEGLIFSVKSSNDTSKLSQFKRKDSRHDPCLQEFWRNEAVEDGIFNKRLPGPHNEGLLMLDGDPTDGRQQQIRDLRRRSLSTGSLPVPLVEHLRHSAPHDGASFTGSKVPRKQKPVAPVAVAPGNVEDKIHEGWLMVLGEDKEWKRLWCVLSQKSLYAYNSPTETGAIDSVNLSGWTLLPGEDEEDMSLAHQEYHSIHMKTDSPEWKPHIREATQRVSIEGLDLERGSNNEFEDRDRLKAASIATQRELQQEFVKLKKQQLLREILKQREQIVNQHQAQGGSPLLSTPEILVSPGSPNRMCRSCSGSDHESSSSSLHRLHDEQNAVVDLVKLRQRKVSTQLKVDSIHRALQGKLAQPKKPKKKGFRLPAGLSKLSGDLASSDESLNEILVPCSDKEGLQLQLKDLHRQLEHINNSILIKQSERLQSEGLSDRSKSRSTPFLCADRGSSLEGSSAESSERGSSESVNKSKSKQKMGIPELIDFRHRTKTDKPEMSFDLRHSWSPNAFENFKISKGERKLERQSPMTCSQEFVTSAVPVQSEAPPLPPRRVLGPKQKSMSSLSPRLPSSSSESSTDKRSRNNKLRISDDALAKIAAFEELLQENMII